MSTEKVVVTITIDTECDHDPQWVRSDPLRLLSVIDGIPNKLQPVFRSLSAKPTYLLAVEVMENEECVKTLKNIEDEIELGTHLHSAFVEPEKIYYEYAGVESLDYQCHCSPDVEYKKLETLTNLYKSRFDVQPRTFRAGRFGAGENTIRSLNKLNYWVDTSVVPAICIHHSEGNINYKHAPKQPYYPDDKSIVKIGKTIDGKKLLEIPVTIKPRLLRSPKWFRPWFSTVDQMKKIARYHLKNYEENRIILLNMMFHSMEVIPKASPYPQTETECVIFLDNLHEILNWCKKEGYEFTTCKEAYGLFKNLS